MIGRVILWSVLGLVIPVWTFAELGLNPEKQPLFNPPPIAPAPTGLHESLTNLLNRAREEQEREDNPKSVFDTTMWKAFVIAEESAVADNWEKSDLILLKLHKLLPDNIMLAEKAATIFAMREAYDRAREIWLSQFSRNPERYEILTQVGKCSLHIGAYDEAIKSLNVAAKLGNQTLEPRFYLACTYVKQSEPTKIPKALGQLTLFEMSILSYWLGADFERYAEFLGETGYLQLASYILGGGEEGSLEIVDIEKVSKQLLTVSRLLNRLDRQLGQRRYGEIETLLSQAFERGVRGLSYEIYSHIYHAINGDSDKARAGMQELVKKHPDRALVQHYYGILLMLLEDYTAAADAFTTASTLEDDPRILLDLIEAHAASGQIDFAFERLKLTYNQYPNPVRSLLNRDSDGLRALKEHPAFGAWMASLVR